MGRLSKDALDKMQRYWEAANYLSVGQIYLLDNPLLEGPRNCWDQQVSLNTI